LASDQDWKLLPNAFADDMFDVFFSGALPRVVWLDKIAVGAACEGSLQWLSFFSYWNN
jgi:hypothetical protein